MKILEKGLKFTPTPKQDNVDLIKDTEEFCRKLRLREYFQNEENIDESLVRNKSNFKPPPNRDKHLDEFIKCLQSSARNNDFCMNTRIKDNINRLEREAIKSLASDNSIVIKEADKGGAIVIMDMDHYREMVLDQLMDTNFYKELVSNEDSKTICKIKKLTSKFADNLTVKEVDYLTNFENKSSNFYGLPKIHKSKEIQDGLEGKNALYIKLPRPTDLKLRPIVAGPACPTHRISNLLDILLKPLCQLVPSYVRDDMDFLGHIPDTVEINTEMVSFDVTSLYTNIPHTLGLEAIAFWIDKYRSEINERFSQDFILEGLKIVLENNHFVFDSRNFLQIKGTAMGTKVAPTYATLVLGFLEEKLISETDRRFGNQFAQYIRFNWKRYLDDCFIFWNRSNEDLQEFHSILNNLHPSIKFTVEKSGLELPFLDILIIKEGRKIITDLYYKKTDSHQYLVFNSCHPSHVKRNIPFNMARRVCTIVIDETRRNSRLQELKTFLLRQKYPNDLIDVAIERAKSIPTTDLRSSTRAGAQENNKEIPLVVTHNPRNLNMYNSVKQCFPILQQSQNLKELIDLKNVIYSRRQPPNLKKLLTRAKFSSNEDIRTVAKCMDPLCGTCPYLKTGETFTFKCGYEKSLQDKQISNSTNWSERENNEPGVRLQNQNDSNNEHSHFLDYGPYDILNLKVGKDFEA
ncbi:uncharacterized protein LOC133202982 [Saccostrea echinata]|uniref:uncharacterized protein LOC133202982 n=1 Tax=Saccostrea echinata TaxID=191078 RepID=UPI002A7FE405|nr:uncharacterized protein LOC133202982 [Saccostrea echinata]